jgi:hypothetical protein
MTQLEAALVDITSFLDRARVPYMLIGGLAIAMWGEPRATLDVDLSVWVDPDGFDDAVRAICAHFSSLPDALLFARRARVLPIATADGVRADIVFASLPLEREFIDRACKKVVEGSEVRVASVEDLIYMKLISERAKDVDDARRLIRRFRGTIDRNYIEPELREVAEALARPDIAEIFLYEIGGSSGK